MKIKVSKVNKVNVNGFYYPRAEMKKVIKKFNDEPDNLNHNIYLSREQSRAHLDHEIDVVDVIGKVNKLELKDDDIIIDFNFTNNPTGTHFSNFVSECQKKNLDMSFFDYKIMMDCMAKLEPTKKGDKATNVEVAYFVAGLDSVWSR